MNTNWRKVRKNYLVGVRTQARQLYMQSLDSPFSYCGLCGEMLVWIQKFRNDEFIEMADYKTALIRLSGNCQSVLVGTVDHIIKIADGGTNDLSNLAGLCVDCHRDKDQETKDGRYCRICLMPVKDTDFRRVHTNCQKDEPFLKYKLGEKFPVT